MNSKANSVSDRESRLESVVAEYLRAVDAGETTPGLTELQARYPDLAEELAEFIADDQRGIDGMPRAPRAYAAVETSCGPDDTDLATDAVIPAPDFGAYERAEEIGHGGIGIVYRARDPELGRELAIKVLRAEFLPNASMVQRFVEEGQIGGQLQHPGICPVHAMGRLPDGRPFFTMKLIRGVTLAALLKERQTPTDDVPRYLQILENVCQTLAYAHSKRVIHRDLKPANIMVGAFGEVQVMDWGLAKVLGNTKSPRIQHPDGEESIRTVRSIDAEDQSRAGTVMGTLAYMPPEQARGEVDRIDERSDVFSLGAILCEVLTGRPPYSGNRRGVMDAIRQEELPATIARLDSCGADAVLIALAKECLNAEPGDRPRDGGEAAQSIASYRLGVQERLRQAELERAAAIAREEEAAAKAKAERKARRRMVALAASVVALFALIGVGFWWADRQAAAKARADSERETERRMESSKNRQSIEIGLDRAESAIRDDNPNYGEIDTALADVDRRLPTNGMDDARSRSASIRKARQMLDRLDDIETRMWMVAADGHSIDSDFAIKNYPLAFREFGLDIENEPASALAEKVRHSIISKKLAVALEEWQGVSQRLDFLELINALDPDSHRSSVRQALATQDKSFIVDKVSTLDGRQLPPAFALYVGNHRRTPQEHGVRILLAAQAANPNHFGLAFMSSFRLPQDEADRQVTYLRIALAIRPQSPLCLNALGAVLRNKKKDLPAAIAAFKASIHSNPNYSVAHYNLGICLRDVNDVDCAVTSFKEATRIYPGYAEAHHELGNALMARNDVDDAIAAFREAIRLDAQYSKPHQGLARALLAKKDLSSALRECKEAILLAPQSAPSHGLLGNLLHHQKNLDGAIAEFNEASRLDPKAAVWQYNLGNALRDKKDLAGAITAYKKAIALDPAYAPAHNNLGEVLHYEKNFDGAIAEFRAALKHDPQLTNARTSLAMVLESRSSSLRRSKDLVGAVAALRELVEIYPKIASAHYELARVLQENKDLVGSIIEFKETVRLSPNHFQAHLYLGIALRDTGQLDAAAVELNEAIRLNPKSVHPLNALATTLHLKQDFVGAVDAYKKALNVDPNEHWPHYPLANVLYETKHVDAAITQFRLAIRFYPNHAAPAQLGLGNALKEKKDFDGAIASYKEAVRLKLDSVSLFSSLAELLNRRGESFAALQVLRDGANTHPAWMFSLGSFYPWETVRYTVLAGTGQGKDAPPESERANLRAEALKQLASDLAKWRGNVAAGATNAKASAHRNMTRWLDHADLSAVRDANKLVDLPASELRAWEQFWTEVRKLRDETAPPRELLPMPKESK